MDETENKEEIAQDSGTYVPELGQEVKAVEIPGDPAEENICDSCQ